MRLFQAGTRTGLWALVVLMLFSTSCIQRKITTKTPQGSLFDQTSWSRALKNELSSARIVVLHTADSMYRLENRSIENDKITALLFPVQSDYGYLRYTHFGRKDIPFADRPDASRTLHLYTFETFEGIQIELDYKQILEYRRVRNNVPLNFAINTGIGLGAFGIFLAIVCNCPRIYLEQSVNTSEYQGSILTGAFSKSLQRTDEIILNTRAENGSINLRFMNELAEDEYLDALKLKRITIPDGMLPVYHTNGGIAGVSELTEPLKAVDRNYRDQITQVLYSDSLHFDFNSIDDPETRNELRLEFDLRSFTKTSGLVIKARQTEWMTAMAELFFQALGERNQEWFDRMDEVEPGRYAEQAEDRGISMRIEVLTPNGWQRVGAVQNAGTGSYKSFFLPLSKEQLSELGINTTGNVRLRLLSAYNFWDLDHVALAQSSIVPDRADPINWSSARDLNGTDLLSRISGRDGDYAELKGAGSGIELSADASLAQGEYLVLEATGYYRHQDAYNGPTNRKAIRYMKPSIGTQRLSVAAWNYERSHN